MSATVSKANRSNASKQPLSSKQNGQRTHPLCQFKADKNWLDPQFHSDDEIKRPHELENEIQSPPGPIDRELLNRIQGSLLGLAIGDALGAPVEFRPHDYLLANPVKDLERGGTWGLQKGQFTDDTSMALCLANSLVARRNYLAYDQLVRYKWWHEKGYMSSTGKCFDIGAATSHSLVEFSHRQTKFAKKHRIPLKELDFLSDDHLLRQFNVNCSEADVAGNGALMRLAPIPLFFYRNPEAAVEFSGLSGQITHGDRKAYDACRYYGALIVAALGGCKKEELLDTRFYEKHALWFNDDPLCREIKKIAKGSYQKQNGYDDGIRGKGYIVNALEAALWAFWSDDDVFEKGALAAVNLGDDTDTTAAIYGQLAGAHYGYNKLPSKWVNEVYAKKFILNLSEWVAYEGQKWTPQKENYSSNSPSKYPTKSASLEDLTSNGSIQDSIDELSEPISAAEFNGKKTLWRRFRSFFNNRKPAKHSVTSATSTPKPAKRLIQATSSLPSRNNVSREDTEL